MIAPSTVSFHGDVLPLLQRPADQQWVNKGFFTLTRPGREMDWLSPASLSKLADPSSRSRPDRSRAAGMFRNPAYESSTIQEQPLIYGDGIKLPPTNQFEWLSVTTLQFLQLMAWERGHFDVGSPPPTATSVDALPLSFRPASLDEAALGSVLGGANHPGVEAPWVLRVPSMWAAPYRLRIVSTTMAVHDYGDQLTPTVTMGPVGPVHGVPPGDLTMWMGVPWHADAASCRDDYRVSGYAPDLSPYLPAFWPAQVPNEVLAEPDYETVMDTSQSMTARRQAFARRRTWYGHWLRSRCLPNNSRSSCRCGPCSEWRRRGPDLRRWLPRGVEGRDRRLLPRAHRHVGHHLRCGAGGEATCPIDW